MIIPFSVDPDHWYIHKAKAGHWLIDHVFSDGRSWGRSFYSFEQAIEWFKIRTSI